ncbi:SPFH domain-containing protein [uncultured Deefgea sp.]|uniref:SPFH domain-containing protein n=1 Tax=uncultured Deefgea sp. TaxID=1304914 RepID=UPI0025984A30|nr:SPFH domain-containing protein [uncultured Deefgea sp.]
MGLGSFIHNQFIDILQWNEDEDGVLAYRFPQANCEIQYGASLTVRESQMAVFLNEGQFADVFGPGRYTLTTRTLPVLTALKNWDKLFQSPFKSDVYFMSTRLQLGRKWGTPQPITLRDADFGMIRMRAFGVYAYQIVDPQLFFSQISGTRDLYTCDDVELQLRNDVVATMTQVLASSDVPFLDMASHQGLMAERIGAALRSQFAQYGLLLDTFTLENISLPDELQKALDNKISMQMIGDLGAFSQYQAAQSMVLAAQNDSGLAGLGVGLGAGVAAGQVMASALNSALAPTAQPNRAAELADGASHTDVANSSPQMSAPQLQLQQLKSLLAQDLITVADYDAAKAAVLKKLIAGDEG